MLLPIVNDINDPCPVLAQRRLRISNGSNRLKFVSIELADHVNCSPVHKSKTAKRPHHSGC